MRLTGSAWRQSYLFSLTAVNGHIEIKSIKKGVIYVSLFSSSFSIDISLLLNNVLFLFSIFFSFVYSNKVNVASCQSFHIIGMASEFVGKVNARILA